MICTFAIDWLALYCLLPKWEAYGLTAKEDNNGGGGMLPARRGPYVAHLEVYGTRQYRYLYTIRKDNEEIAYIQTHPHSPVLDPAGCIVKFANRILYMPEMWSIVESVLSEFKLEYKSISRIDLARDFHEFLNGYECEMLILDFINGNIRKKGRAKGTIAFRQRKDGLQYTGLTFGTHESDTRVYLYNKSIELREVHDKPYIRDFWAANGLDPARDVWRLEISLKASALTFEKPETQRVQTYDIDADVARWLELFDIMKGALFTFVEPNNRNISRCTIIELLPSTCDMKRKTLRNVTGSGRAERIMVKSLAQMVNKYRYFTTLDHIGQRHDVERVTNAFVTACDLEEWYKYKRKYWDDATRIPT